MTALRLCLLGGFELKASRAMANTPRKVKALLAYLALSPDVPHARDKLATLLWETSGEGQARQSLRQALVDLRKALPAADNILHCTHETVTLGAAAIEVDVLELKRLYDRATPEAFEQAAGLYRGELLDGLNSRAPAFEDWLALEATRVREQALGAMTQLLDHCLATGAIEPGVQWALHLLALDPLRESAHRALMQLYARQGRYGSALKQYDNCRRVLACDLGVAPEAATTALYKELAQGRKGPPPTSSAKAEALGAPRRIPAESGDPEDHNLL